MTSFHRPYPVRVLPLPWHIARPADSFRLGVVGVFSSLAPAIMISSWLLAARLQPSSYNSLRQTISVLAGYAAKDRWIVTAALYCVSISYFVAAAGLSELRTPARVDLMIAGCASIGIACCPEPSHGSTPQHAFWTTIGALAIAALPSLSVLREQGTAVLGDRATAAASLLFLALLLWTAVETHLGADLGLAERLTTSVEITWPLLITIGLRRSRSRENASLGR